MNATTIEITLELELDGDNIGGTAVHADGTRRSFSGWIGLMGLVDSLLDEARNTGLGKDVITEKNTGGEDDADS